nr:nicotinate-nucleotide--dimethylbenzimidazole phosphoribosyltransferase [Lachnospiraceae bacterium]
MGTDLNERLDIRRYDTDSERKAKERFDHIAKPIDGLGVFEDLICRIAGIQGRTDVDISKRIVVIMCADNGITEEGISQTSWEVTAKVAGSMSNGRSSVCLMAESAGADTLPVDIGIKQTGDIRSFEDITEGEKGHYRLLNRKVANGTYNFAERPAMTGQQFDEAFFNGVRLAGELSERGYQIICTGEMGIGNTTTAAGITSALLKLPASETAGRGSGLSDEAYERKIRVLDQAIQRYDLY